ncbi:MAG: hypothetical protein LBF83_03570 [Spirochaetaceae bacterium]|jgi:hypothetical protein|nr:hypothetical protein [Spirochaetaceae bacterium]
MKKSLIFWFAAVTCAALFLVGCESPTNGDAGAAGAAGPATLPADATPELLEAYFGSTNKVFVVAALGAGTFEVPAGKTLAVVGTVDISSVNTVINAYYGMLDVSDGGFTVDGGNVFIVPQAKVAEVKAAASGGVVPATFVGTPTVASPALDAPAVFTSLGIGGTGNLTAAEFVTFTTSHAAYVVGDVTIDTTGGAVLTSANLVVYGKIKAGNTAGTGSLTIPSTVEGSLTATSALGITGIDNLFELDTGTYTVTSADTTVDLDKLDSTGTGKLELTGVVTKVDIGEGSGNIEFKTATPALADTASVFGNTGTTTFQAAAGVTNQAVTFKGPVVFNATFTRTTNGVLTFEKDVTIKKTATIVLGGTDNVVLAEGAAIKVADTSVNTVLTASGGEVAITPADGAVLEATDAKKITVKTAAITGLTGTLAVAAGAELVASMDVTVGTGSLVLNGATGTDGAKLTGTGKVAFGYASISGSTDGWQAVGANTSIAFSGATTAVAITGKGTSPKLVGAGATVGAITIGTTDGATLTLTNAEINVAAGGSILIKDPSSGSNIVKLASSDAIIGGLTGGTSNQTLVEGSITNAAIDLDGTNGVQAIGSAGAGNVDLKGKGDGSASTITVASSEGADATIDKGTLIGANG